MTRKALRMLVPALLLAPMIAFAHGGKGGEKKASMTKLTEANIFAIASTAHQAEIDAAQLAISKSTNPEVKSFAEHMVTDHTAAMTEEKALAAKLTITPEDNDDVRQLKQDSDATATKLRSLTGAEFDRAYINAAVKDHQMVLDTLSKKLIPSAKNADLKKHLTSLKTTVTDHHKQAKDLQKKLGPAT